MVTSMAVEAAAAAAPAAVAAPAALASLYQAFQVDTRGLKLNGAILFKRLYLAL